MTEDEVDLQLAETFEEAWARHFAEHPEVLASWRHQNGYWPQDHPRNAPGPQR